ncbi:MAG: tetratricopeptide repeat protein [Luteolibacter sp.]
MKLVLLICLLFGSLANANDVFDQANASLEAGRYGEAIESYEKLLEEGARVSVLNNLGSAYFHKGDFGRAILAFERSLVLDPGNPHLKKNLEKAQEKAAAYPSDQKTNGFLDFAKISNDGMAKYYLFVALLLPVAAGLFWFSPKWGKLAFVILGINIALLKLAYQPNREKEDPNSRGIVVAKTATVRLSPFEKAEDKGQLPAGREVSLGKLQRGYYWVNSPEIKGWLSENEVEPVIP